MATWFQEFLNAGEEAKRPHSEGCKLKSIYERVGFVDVHERKFKVPLNGWAKDQDLKEIGRLMEMNMQMGLSAFSLAPFNRVYGRTPEEIEVRNLFLLGFSRFCIMGETEVANNEVIAGVSG